MFVIIVSGPVKSRSSRSFFTEIFFFYFFFLPLKPNAIFSSFHAVSIVHHARRSFCPTPLRGVSGGSDPLLPSHWWSFRLCLFSELCVCGWCSGDPTAPPSITAPPVIFLCWLLSSILHGKIPVLEKWWRTTNQRFGHSPLSWSHTSP